MATTQQPTNAPEARRDRDDAAPGREIRIERSFAPGSAEPPACVARFTAGVIDQARVGRILLVCPTETEVGAHNWQPFASWLVDEVQAVNGVGGVLILDLRRVDRLSSRGLRALALGWRELAAGGQIAVCGLNRLNAEIFAISQYDQLFEIYPDATAAYRALAVRRPATA
ncbi:STAS domain-containing protein [Phenylobacterium sp.]|uniref:STAS domain-containing protein n=1 Tax=Phenylobacterium sp. TaxID=1871053 RepID=UPI0025D0B344|nr:STAS domain-containing protein [Phenylobacterium sp.]